MKFFELKIFLDLGLNKPEPQVVEQPTLERFWNEELQRILDEYQRTHPEPRPFVPYTEPFKYPYVEPQQPIIVPYTPMVPSSPWTAPQTQPWKIEQPYIGDPLPGQQPYVGDSPYYWYYTTNTSDAVEKYTLDLDKSRDFTAFMSAKMDSYSSGTTINSTVYSTSAAKTKSRQKELWYN